MKAKSSNKRATLTVPEAAQLLGVSAATLYEAVRLGQIPALRIAARRVIIPRVAFERMLEEGSLNASAGGNA